MTNGSKKSRPDFRPVISNVTILEKPDEPTTADALFRTRAIQLGR
jgi:hypothetical protein